MFHLRYIVLAKPNRIQALSISACLKLVLLVLAVSFFFAVMPLFGWSRYALEGLKISCSIDWTARDFNGMSYNIAALLFVYLIPVIVLCYTTLKNIFLV